MFTDPWKAAFNKTRPKTREIVIFWVNLSMQLYRLPIKTSLYPVPRTKMYLETPLEVPRAISYPSDIVYTARAA